MSKQTAVEWLMEQLLSINPTAIEWHQAIEKAKEMEKQQIMDAFDVRKINIAFDKKTTSEQYYNETFNQ